MQPKRVDLPVFGLPTSATLRTVASGEAGGAPARLARRIVRFHQDTEETAGSQTDFVAAGAEDAGISGPEHLDPAALSQSELPQSVDMIGVAFDLEYLGRLAGEKFLEGHEINHAGGLSGVHAFL
ncbi:MAG: hypothetical protein NTW96_10185 [Planctomycetia bacterium]|nr:hypothetical protein [Planctomycetia bacterium]